LAGVVLVLMASGCQSIEVTRDYEPAPSVAQRVALWSAVALIPLVAGALWVFGPRQRRPGRLVTAGAFGFAVAGCAVLLGLAIGAGAAMRVGGLGCPAVADPERPATLMQLGCTPGYDDSGMLLAVGALVGIPLAVGCLAVSRELMRGHGQLAFGLVAAVATGGAAQVAINAGASDGTLHVALIAGAVTLPAAACLLLDSLLHDPDQSLTTSSGTTVSQRSLQSSQR
jgi:hypothetical protein